MIEAVSTSPVQSARLRATPQTVASFVSAQEPPKAAGAGVLRLRMDNKLDMAILELRSQESGEVMKQYPSDFQIRAFQRAAELQEAQAEQARAVETQQSAPAPEQPSAAPAPDTVATSASGDGFSAPDIAAATAGPAISSQSIVV